MSDEKESKSGLSLQTLLISSASAVVAAVVVPMFWERGSLIATAVTPIIVALASEALNRPAKVITQVTPRVARRSATGAAIRSKQPSGVGARGDGPERMWGPEDDPFGLRTPERSRRRLPIRIAVVTGLLAAVIGAAIVTASELAIFGHSISGSDRSTSVFGGRTSPTEEETPTAVPEESETAEPDETAAPEESATAAPTPTVTETPAPLTAEPTPTPSVAAPTPTP
ncbi:MAG TPA: hypothetical protein VFZ00_29120 [Solirubrobacter sp.]|nr:hypothetical protein [Solirubrobacter sp.]